MNSYLPNLRVKVAMLLINHLKETVQTRFNNALDDIYQRQSAHYPDLPVGFRHRNKTYCQDPALVDKPTRFARLHPELVDEFEHTLKRFRGLLAQDEGIRDCVYFATQRAGTFSDLFRLLPSNLIAVLPDTVPVDDESIMDEEIVESFKASHKEALQAIRERLVLRAVAHA